MLYISSLIIILKLVIVVEVVETVLLFDDPILLKQ
jgi:hypothetical protein